MLRRLPLVVAFFLIAGCGSEDKQKPSGNIFPATGGSGGSGGTAVADAGPDADSGDAFGGSAGSAGSPDSGTDASQDVSTDTGPVIECVEDPIPAQGQGYCVTVDGDGYHCNPVTSAPCNIGGGETCEFDGERFVCMPQDIKFSAPCELCGAPYSELCIPGFTCLGLDGKCTRYCCDSLQCAVGEVCVMQPPTALGICQAKSDQVLSGFVGDPPADAGADVVDSGPPTYGAECEPPEGFGDGSCVPLGTSIFDCNPVTNEGCDASAGEACDEVNGSFVCVTGTHEHGICEPCTSTSCAPGSTCIPFLGCTKYCCSDADCTPGECHAMPGGFGVGTCREPMEPDAG